MNRLQVGIDFSEKKADFCLLFPDGQPLEPHVSFANSCSGYSSAKQLLLDALDTHAFDGVDISGEATGYLWLPFFLQLSADPDLTLRNMDLFLLNPRWVKWFKKCFAEDHKSDEKDPFYIAERTRTHRPDVTWSPPDYLPLRFYTRLRFHIVQNLAREKCYFSAFLFLKASSYRCIKPFSDVFGVTSRLILTQQPTLDELADLPVEDLASRLYEISGHHLSDSLNNARKLQRVARESFPLKPSFYLSSVSLTSPSITSAFSKPNSSKPTTGSPPNLKTIPSSLNWLPSPASALSSPVALALRLVASDAFSMARSGIRSANAIARATSVTPKMP
jgi:hypothetical protein